MEIEWKTEGKLPFALFSKEQGLSKRFGSIKQVRDFLDQERIWLTELNKASRRGVMAEMLAHFPALAPDAAGAESVVRALHDLLRLRPPLSEGRYGPFLAAIAKAAPEHLNLAYRVIAQRINPEARLSLPQGMSEVELRRYGFLIDMVEALRVDKHLSAATHEAYIASKKSADELASFHAQGRDDHVELKMLLDDFRAVSMHEVAEFENTYRDALLQAKQQLDAHRNDSTASLDALRAQLESHLVTKAPTQYWNDKAFWHGVYASVSGAIFALVLGFAMWLFMVHGLEYVSNATTRIIEAGPESGVAALVPLLFVTVPSLAVAWVLRHISRVIIQNLNLQADAKLRGTIAHTYLALTAKDKPSEAQLAIALQALFRPLDGSEHAEVAPPNLSDIIRLMPGGAKS